LHNQVRLVTAEKKDLVEEAQKIITVIRQMEASLDDSKSRRDNKAEEDNDLKITYPLTRCLQVLKEKHIQISRIHRERYEQVKSTHAPDEPNFRGEPLTVGRTCPGPRVILAPS